MLGAQHTFEDCLWRGKRFTCEYTNTTDPAVHEGAPATPPRHLLSGEALEGDRRLKAERSAQHGRSGARQEHALQPPTVNKVSTCL